MPSLVSCVSAPVAPSRTQRLKSRMKAARFLSGESDSFRPPPPRPPRPPPDTGAALESALEFGAHLAPCASHIQARPAALNLTVLPSSDRSISVKGRCAASYLEPDAAESAAARRA